MTAERAAVSAASVHAGDALPALAVEVTARTVVLGASATRDWQPQHHDHAWATERAGTKDIFLNTPAQAGWIERYLTDWTGPRGRLGRMRFRMRRSVVPGDLLVFSGVVEDMAGDEAGCWWASVAVTMRVGEERVTEATARVALPADEHDNPWARSGNAWRP